MLLKKWTQVIFLDYVEGTSYNLGLEEIFVFFFFFFFLFLIYYLDVLHNSFLYYFSIPFKYCFK
jgi:hypothetical protein